MPKPSSPLLLAAHKRNPLPTAATQPLPNIAIPLHSPRLPRTLECLPSRGRYTMSEGLVVPEGGVLKDEPSAWLADAAPALSFVAMASDVLGGVEVCGESEVLLMGG